LDTRSRTNGLSAQLTLRQLSCFVTVAEERHFRRAAIRLNMSQPPLTLRIQELERDLGVQLFARVGHQIELTEGGRLIFAEAKATLEQANQVRNMASRVRLGEAGDLRLTFAVSVSFVRAFSDAIDAFQRDHPGVTVDVTQRIHQHALEEFQQHKTDICVVRYTGPHLDGVEQMVIARDQLMLVLPANHPKALADRVALGDVASERFIQFPSEMSTVLFKKSEALWNRAGRTPCTIRKADSGLGILALVSGGFGNAILPGTLSAIQVPNVIWKPIDMDEQWTSSEMVMLYRVNARNKNAQSRFVDYVRRLCLQPE